MKSIYDNLTIQAKTYAVVGMCISALLGVGLFSLYQMNKIGVELVAIAEEDIPLTNVVTKITTHQLEQTIQFEKLMRHAVESEHNREAVKSFEAAVKDFNKYGHHVSKEIKQGEERAQHGIDHAHTEAAKQEYSHVLSVLKRIETEHKAFDKKAADVVAMLAQKEITEGLKQGESLEATLVKFDHELEALLTELEKFTAEAALTAEHHEQQAIVWIAILCAVATVLAGAASWYVIAFSVVRPIHAMTDAMTKLAEDDLDTDVPDLEVRNEIGEMARAVQVFKEKMAQAAELKSSQSKIHEGQKRRADAIEMRTSAFEEAIAQSLATVVESAEQMEQSSQSMSTTAEQTNAQSAAVSAAAEEASMNVQTVAAATEQLNASIAEIAGQIGQSRDAAASAVAEVDQANENVMGLARAAQSIGDVVTLISDIAEQTNLLALNATIEAARAGEIPARGLPWSHRKSRRSRKATAKATEQISTQIGEIQSSTDSSVQAIQSIGTVVQQISERSMTIAAAVEEQTSATLEIARNVSEAAKGTEEVTSNITDVASAAGNTGAAAGEVLSVARDLKSRAGALRSEIDSFVEDVKVA